MKTKKSVSYYVIRVIFVLYLVVLFYLVFGLDRVEHNQYQYNLVLLDEIKRYFKYRDIVGNRLFIVNIVGNIVGFIPFGLLYPCIARKYSNWFFVVLLSFEFSLFIEVMQLLLRVGSFDVDDLLMNTLGGCIGCSVYYLVKRRKKHGKKKK